MVRGRSLAVLLVIVVAGAGLWWYGARPESRVFALGGQTARAQWSTPFPRDARWSAASTALDGQLFVWFGTRDAEDNDGARLVAYDAESGAQRWAYEPAVPQTDGDFLDTNATTAYVPLVVHDLVLVTLVSRVDEKDVSALVALELHTGAVRWTLPDAQSSQLPLEIDTSAVVPVDDGTLLTLAYENSRFVMRWIDSATGKIARTAPLPPDVGPVNRLQLVSDEQRAVLNIGNAIFLLDPQTGAINHKIVLENHQALLHNNVLYISTDDALYAYDATTAQQRWQAPIPSEWNGNFAYAIVDQDQVYVLAEQYIDIADEWAWLLALDTTTGKERWRGQVGGGDTTYDYQVPKLVGDNVYILGQNGVRHVDAWGVTAYAMTDGTAQWHVPMRSERSSFDSVVTDGTYLFETDHAPRWRHWIMYINPQWR